MSEKQPDRPTTQPPSAGGGTAVSSSSSNHPLPQGTPDLDMQTFVGSIGEGRSFSQNLETRVGSAGGRTGYDPIFQLGAVIARRYEIVALLGEGGMGAVYKANDRELDRMVALKVIRPDLARNPEIIERFRQELRLSHQVTHKNVIRIYDLGEDGGTKFITMEYVEGKDLRSLIAERRKFAPAEAVEMMEQLCRALEAAHSVGVIHRDLKPQNIMRDHSGRLVLMDFGLARSIAASEGMTQTGALVGTMAYMSPEQALGKELDQRSDIFALGLIFYELLTGLMPFKGESELASLIKRTQERAAPIITHDATVPARLDRIVCKCLECDPASRYTHVAEVLHDLEDWEGKYAAASLAFNPSVGSHDRMVRWTTRVSVSIVVALLLATGAFFGRKLLTRSGGAHSVPVPSTSLAIVPYHNASGDPTLDWLGASISDTLTTGVGQSAKLRIVSAERLNQLMQDLHISGQSAVDVATLRRLAEFTNADTVVFGKYLRIGAQIHIDTTVLDLKHDTRSVIKTDVPSEKELLTAINTLADDVQKRLAADPDALKDLQAHAVRPSTTSIQALRAYDDGLQLMHRGKSIDAAKQFEAATQEDPSFALAFSKLGETYASLGHDDQAENAARKAVALSDSMPAQERYLITASYEMVKRDTQKAIASYEELAKADPQDSAVQLALAGLYEHVNNFTEAKEHLGIVLARDPKYVDALLASGRIEVKSGNPQAGLEYLTRALNLAIQLDNQEQKAAILQATGIAYSMLDKPQDALSNYQQSLAIKKQIGDKRGMAASVEQIASIQDSMGKPDEALASYKEALALRQEIGDREGIANTLIDTGSFYHDHGKPDDALKLFTSALQVARDLNDQSKQALCLNNIGSIHLDKGDYQDAVTYLDQARSLREKLNVPGDVAESLHNLAEANTKLGQFDTALNQYLQAIVTRRSINDQRGMALESESMAHIFAARGRFGSALGSMHDALKTFDELKEQSSFAVAITGGWGDLLSQVGRGDEGRPMLEQALNQARQIKDDAGASSVQKWIGDAAFYKGDYNAARQQYDAALQIATRRNDRERILVSKAARARNEIAQGHAQATLGQMKSLAQDADALGLKSLSVECSIDLGAALLATKDFKGAREELDRALARAESLGLMLAQARIHYLLASLLTQTGSAHEATPHYREVVRILETTSKEEGAGRILERADIQSMYREAMKGFQGAS